MQVSRFTSGGFVVHKIKIGKLTYSAWFDVSGKLIDCCTRSGRSVPVRCVRVRSRMASVGIAWKNPVSVVS